MVSVWFKNEAALILMIEIMKVMREKMDKTKYCVNGERVTKNLGMSPRRNLWDGLMRCSSKASWKPDETTKRSKPFMDHFKFLPSQKWDRKDKGTSQPNTRARAKVTRMKVGKSIRK